jgi:hypothetical protein
MSESEFCFGTYFDDLKLEVKRLANVLEGDFPWMFDESHVVDLVTNEIELVRSSNLGIEDEDYMVHKLSRIRRRMLAFVEAVHAFVDDAAEICKPDEVRS